MIRAKHLGTTLSQSARSLFLNGPTRSTCPCSEDDAYDSERPLRSNAQSSRPSSSILSKASASAALLSASVDSGTSANSRYPDNRLPSGESDVFHGSSDRVDSVSHGDELSLQEDMSRSSSPHVADQFMRAGMAAVGILSDLVNYRIPFTEGSALNKSPSSSVVGPTKGMASSKSSRKGSDDGGSVEGASNFEVEKSSNHHPQKVDGKFKKKASPSERQFSVSESVSRILHRHCKWSPAAELALLKLDCSLDAYQANQILKQLQDHSVALSFFCWLKRQPGFVHDGHTYTTMIGILGRAKQFGAIDELLDQMVSEGCKPNVVTYNRLIHSYGRANFLTEAIGVFDQMQKSGCEPDRVTYCTLIDIHAKAGYLDVAVDMYRRMQREGLSPDTFTYSVIINCLGKAGHLPTAHKLFCEMVDRGCIPNLVTYNIMIALHAKARNYRTSLRLYRDMQGAGFDPDRVTYSIVMEVLGHCGYLEEAEAVFGEMRRKGWVPDEPVYGLLVDLWGKAGNVGKAWDWYNAMLDAGLRPNVPTCNSLLSTFLRVRRFSDAFDLLQGMLGLGLRPSLQTYTLLLSCCTESISSDGDRSFCCRLMASTGHPAHEFLLSMPASTPDGNNVRAHVGSFLDAMRSEDRESKRGLVDAVVDFFRKTGLKEEAGSIWEAAAGRNVYPDAVRRKGGGRWIVVNLHVMSEGTAVTALCRTLAGFRREMLESGAGPPGRIDIVTGWGRRSRVTGTSMVRQAVERLLKAFGFPFFTVNGNSGCFVGCGQALNQWLMQSCVERMHLL